MEIDVTICRKTELARYSDQRDPLVRVTFQVAPDNTFAIRMPAEQAMELKYE